MFISVSKNIISDFSISDSFMDRKPQLRFFDMFGHKFS